MAEDQMMLNVLGASNGRSPVWTRIMDKWLSYSNSETSQFCIDASVLTAGSGVNVAK